MFHELLAINDPDWKKKIQSRNPPPAPRPGFKIGPDGKLSTDLPLPTAPAPAPAPISTPPRFYAGQIVQSKMNPGHYFKILWFSACGNEAALVPAVGPYNNHAYWNLNFLEHVK